MWGTQRDVTERVQADRERARAQRSMQVALEPWTLHVDDAGAVPAALEDPEAIARVAGVEAVLHAGRTAEVVDTTAAPAGLRAFIVVPQLRDGQWVGALTVVSTTPRGWTPRERALVTAVAERTCNAVEKLRLDASLRASEARYRSLVSASSAMIAVTSSDGRFTEPQPGWEAYTGQRWDEYRDYGFLDALHPDDREAAERAWMNAWRAGKIFEYEARLRHAASRSYRTCAGRAVPVRDEDGSIREWVISITDVDERRRAEERLRASEAKWRLVFESVRDFAIFTLDLERRVTRWNQGATALLGYEESEIVGRLGDVFFPAEDPAAGVPQREAEIALATGCAESERWRVRKDGTSF